MRRIVLPVFVALLAVGFGSGFGSVMPGGPMDIPLNDTKALEALDYAVGKHNDKHRDTSGREVEEAVRFQKQIVSGTKYILTVRMRKTGCQDGGADEPSQTCVVQQNQVYECTFSVVVAPWKDLSISHSEECNGENV
ncbi:cystatin C (amyloid angiopathy and cerebral hemorrhage) [Brachionichthys hirsutus]|uniref:cystatin C (amyloid angiopathy and cerebral hemorrhage) n=1 Tax=Brachionichthys hirsutus TaxID=412623 RepID=UPI003605337B